MGAGGPVSAILGDRSVAGKVSGQRGGDGAPGTTIANSPCATPSVENHTTCSCTRSSQTRYGPLIGGALTEIATVADPPGVTSSESGARAPSHTTIDPSGRIRWYDNRT